MVTHNSTFAASISHKKERLNKESTLSLNHSLLSIP